MEILENLRKHFKYEMAKCGLKKQFVCYYLQARFLFPPIFCNASQEKTVLITLSIVMLHPCLIWILLQSTVFHTVLEELLISYLKVQPLSNLGCKSCLWDVVIHLEAFTVLNSPWIQSYLNVHSPLYFLGLDSDG